jgi:hypothetical protein
MPIIAVNVGDVELLMLSMQVGVHVLGVKFETPLQYVCSFVNHRQSYFLHHHPPPTLE